MRMYFQIFVFTAIFSAVCFAQNFWQPLNGPKKGAIRCVAINAQNQIFCKADSLYRSTDNGVTWQKASLLSFEMYAVSFSSLGNIYLSTPYEIYRSTDNCSTWIRMGTGLSGSPYTKVVFNAQGHGFIGSTTNGVYKTTNDCSTFVASNAGLTTLKIRDILVKPDGNLFAATEGGGVFLSTDNGGSWSAVNGTMTQKNIYYLSLKSTGELICANVNGRIFSTADNGTTWTQVPTITFAATPKVFQMNQLDHIYVFMNSVMYRTTNNGTKWDTVNTGLTGGNFQSSAINSSGYIFLGDASASGNMHRTVQATTAADDFVDLRPSDYMLFQNYPNPFNPATTITYQIPQTGLVTLKVYDAIGSEAATLVNQQQEAGSYNITFDGSKLNSGVYFYTLRSGAFSATKKLSLVK